MYRQGWESKSRGAQENYRRQAGLMEQDNMMTHKCTPTYTPSTHTHFSLVTKQKHF